MPTLMLIDLQKGMCNPAGSAGAGGLAAVAAELGTLKAAARALEHARSASFDVVHVRLGFDATYGNRTNATARFAGHQKGGRFALGSFDTEWCEEVAPAAGETTVAKGSVSPFASTALFEVLARRGQRELVVAGVATHLAVESAAREAADRGIAVTVLGDACAAPEHLHRHSLEQTLPAFATVRTVDEFVSGR